MSLAARALAHAAELDRLIDFDSNSTGNQLDPVQGRHRGQVGVRRGSLAVAADEHGCSGEDGVS